MARETDMELENLCHNVVWLRKNAGLSKREMAAIMGIGIGSLNKIEDGQLPARLTASVLFAIQDHFGVSTSSLLNGRLGTEK